MRKTLHVVGLLVAGLTACSDQLPELSREQAALADELRTAPPGSILIPAKPDGVHLEGFHVVCGRENGKIRTASVGLVRVFTCDSIVADGNTTTAEMVIFYDRIVDIVEPSDPEFDGLAERLVTDVIRLD